MSILTSRATDISLSDAQLCEAMGYLATPGRMRIEAQVPYGKEKIFEKEYPEQGYYHMKCSSDKQSFQLRIMMNSTSNCPDFLRKEITAGGGTNSPGCISRGLFVEKIVGEYGFRFTDEQQPIGIIRNNVQRHFPQLIDYFDKGFNIPL